MSLDLAALQCSLLECKVDEQGIGTIRLNRPPANALNILLLEELTAAVRAARFDPRVKVAVVGSAIVGVFSSGLDINEMAEPDLTRLELIDHLFKDLVIRPMRTARKLFVAVIEGHCLGGGLEMALAADIRLAAGEGWRCGLPEVRLGGMPGGGGMQLLARLIGPSKALRLALTGERISPEQALDLGIFDERFDGDDAPTQIDDYLRRLAQGPAQSHGAIKLAIREGLELAPDQGMLFERELYRELYRSSDLAEGMQAFREKRQPHFGLGQNQAG